MVSGIYLEKGNEGFLFFSHVLERICKNRCSLCLQGTLS